MTMKTIYHLEFHSSGKQHYFGSVSAIYEMFSPTMLGVSKWTLYSYRITPERPYSNDVCTIRRSVINRKANKKRINK